MAKACKSFWLMLVYACTREKACSMYQSCSSKLKGTTIKELCACACMCVYACVVCMWVCMCECAHMQMQMRACLKEEGTFWESCQQHFMWSWWKNHTESQRNNHVWPAACLQVSYRHEATHPTSLSRTWGRGKGYDKAALEWGSASYFHARYCSSCRWEDGLIHGKVFELNSLKIDRTSSLERCSPNLTAA